ncbi:MAG: hypothetical protein HQK66_07035 [Desulfamplus sp.]|nr:hypothetical protein [Desulfamplus sp.]
MIDAAAGNLIDDITTIPPPTIKYSTNKIVITITDDGRGINPEQLRKKALQKKLFSEEKIQSMNEDELMQLIFMSDFSTRNEVTKMSGRGMGMAAVKQELEKLNGNVKVKSRPGKGTEFLFYIPFS